MFWENSEFSSALKRYRKIMVFGAKKNASNTHLLLEERGFEIECYIVSKREDNPYFMNGKPVKVFDEISTEYKQDGLVVITQRYEDNDKMEKILLRAGFKNMISGPMQVKRCSIDKESKFNLYYINGTNMFRPFDDEDVKLRKDKINVTIYAVTSHKNIHIAQKKYDSKFIKYIQAGAKLTDKKICEIRDDMGGGREYIWP